VIKIVGLQKVTLLDYPDRVAATVFLAGCNLACGFCHNRWMIDIDAAPEAMSPDAFLRWLETRRGLLQGVCVSGGEPLLQQDLPEFLSNIRAMGFAIKLDTNGTWPKRLARVIEDQLADYVAMDLKAPLETDSYAKATGRLVDIQTIRESMAILRTNRTEYEFRTTVHPYLDAQALLRIADELEADDRWYLQPFVQSPHVLPAVARLPALEAEEIRQLLPKLRAIVPHVSLRGA